MASHRFWKVRFEPRPPSSYAILTKIEVHATVGGPDVLSTATKTQAPGTFNLYGGVMANLYDATDSNYFGGYGGADWGQVFDFGSAQAVAEVVCTICSAGGTPSTGYPWKTWIQGSDDNLNWVTYGPGYYTPTGLAAGSTYTMPVDASPMQFSDVYELGIWAPASWPLVFDHHLYGDLRTGYGGDFKLSGDTAIADSPDIPVGRRVRLYDALTGDLVAEQWSDAITGAWEFTNLANRDYVVVTMDHTHTYNAVVRDNLQSLLEYMT